MYLAIAVVLLYNAGIGIVFYVAYKRSDNAFMSPKKYKRALLICEKNKELQAVLESIDNENIGIKPERVIDRAIDIIKSRK
jgi:hypothetical protein